MVVTEAGGLETVSDAGRAAVLLNPLRLAIVKELREPDSASGLARKLNLPRQKLNYHLRELESAGFLELVEERRKGNCTERLLRSTATSYLVAPAALGDLGPDPDRFRDRFSASYLVALAARTIQELATLTKRAATASKKLPTLSLSTEVRFASAESQAAFTSELTQELSRLTAKYHDEKAPRGRWFRLLVGSYPKITRPGSADVQRSEKREG